MKTAVYYVMELVGAGLKGMEKKPEAVMYWVLACILIDIESSVSKRRP